DVGLQAVDGQDDPARPGPQPLQPAVVAEGHRQQLVVAVQQVGDGALADGQPAAGAVGVDRGHRAAKGVAEGADQGDDVEPELVAGQGEAALGLGAVGPVVGGAAGVAAAADGEVQPGEAVQGGDGAAVGVIRPQQSAAVRAVLAQGL